MKRAKWVLVVTVVALAAGLMTFAPVQAEEKIMKVGCCMPFSGPLASWGRDLTDGVKAVADYYNAKGGLNIGGDTYKIKFIEADTKFTPEGSLAAARRLVEAEKVDWIEGALASFTTLAMQEVTEPAKIISLNTAAGHAVIDKAKGKSAYSFRSYIEYEAQVPAILKWLAANYPDAKIAMLSPNVDGVWDGQEIADKAAPTLGLELVYTEFFDPSTTDFYPFLVKLMAAKPDVIFPLSGPPQQMALIVKGARELGFKGSIITPQPPDIEIMNSICGPEMLEGFLSMAYALSGPMVSDKTKEWVAHYKEHYGGNPGTGIVQAPAACLIFQAYEEAGTLDSDKVLAILESGRTRDTVTGFKATFGGAKVFGHNHQLLCPQYILKVQNNENVPIYEVPIADLLYAGD